MSFTGAHGTLRAASQPSAASNAWNGTSRETRLYSIAPISNNLVLAYLGQHVLGMPRSY
jgi:hypothetical protein